MHSDTTSHTTRTQLCMGSADLDDRQPHHADLETTECSPTAARLTVTLHLELLATLPVGTHRWTTLGGAVGLGAETTVGTASRGDTTELTVLVHRVDDPVDARITTDGLVGRIHHDDLEVLVGGIGVHPVGVEHTHVAGLAGHTLLGHAAQGAAGLEGGDTSIAGLSVHLTLVDRTLAATTADTHTVDAVALLGLVAKTASLVRTSRAGG